MGRRIGPGVRPGGKGEGDALNEQGGAGPWPRRLLRNKMLLLMLGGAILALWLTSS